MFSRLRTYRHLLDAYRLPFVVSITAALLVALALFAVQLHAQNVVEPQQTTQVGTMPNVLGLDSGVAMSQLAGAGIPVNIAFRTERCNPYTVLESIPAVGQPVPTNERPLLFVCDPMLMPNLVEMNRDEAIATLNAMGIEPTIVETADRRFPERQVWSTEPSPNQPILPETAGNVTLYVIKHVSHGHYTQPFIIDPVTGIPVDPVTGVPVDPATGEPLDPTAPTDPTVPTNPTNPTNPYPAP